MLSKLPYDELRALFPKLKDRVLFSERDLLIKQCNTNEHKRLNREETLNEFSKETFNTCTTSPTLASTRDLLDDLPIARNDICYDTFDMTSNIDSEVNEAENTDTKEQQQQNLPLDFAFVSLPEEIQVIIDANELIKLRGHTNHR